MFRKVGLCLVLMCLASVSLAEELPQKFSGDGLTILVKTLDEDSGKVTGDLIKGESVFPFTGQIQEENTGEAVTGTFLVEGEPFKFTSRVDAKTGDIIFSTGSKSYTLRPDKPAPKPVANNPLNDDPAPNNNDNPLNETKADKIDNPLNVDTTAQKPQVDNPLNTGSNDTTPQKPGPKAGETLRLKLAKFDDISMGGLPAYVMLVPEDWKASGNIQWGPAEDPFPQPNVRVDGPDGSAVAYFPGSSYAYLFTRPAPGMLQIEPQGTPPPESVGEFFVAQMAKAGRVQNVVLIEDRRDQKAEEAIEAQDIQSGGFNRDIDKSVHHITCEFDKNGTRYRQISTIFYARFPDSVSHNLVNQSFMITYGVTIAAPKEIFEQRKAFLYQIAGTYRALPKWWVQYFEVRREIAAQRHRDTMAAIKARGAFYNQMSDMQFDNYKRNMAASDKAQKDRIDSIYERQDYKDVDGNNVNLTFHYKHVYSNGEGGYVLTNNPLKKPNDGNYKEIEPAR